MKKIAVCVLFLFLLAGCSQVKETPHYLPGEVAALGDFEVTVSDTYTTDKVLGQFVSYTPTSEGNIFLVLSLSVKNNGKTADTLIDMFTTSRSVRPTLIYGDGYEFSPSHEYVDFPDIIGESISPLSTKEGNLFFSVPPETVSGNEPLSLLLEKGTEKVIFELSSSPIYAATPEPTETPVPTPTPEPTPKPETLHFEGESITMGDWEVVYNGYSTPEKMEDKYGFQDYTPKDGEIAVCISLTVKNNGKEQAAFISEYTFSKTIWPTLVYADGYAYNAAHSAIGGPDDIIGNNIAPLASLTGDIFFAVPEQVVSGDQPLVFKLQSSSETVTFSVLP